MNDKSYVTMEQHQCPICLTVFDTDAILMDKRLRERFHMKTITGHSLCSACEDRREEYLALVACSNPEGDKINLGQEQRTGDVVHIKRSKAKELFNIPEEELDNQPFVFCEAGVVTALMAMAEGVEDAEGE